MFRFAIRSASGKQASEPSVGSKGDGDNALAETINSLYQGGNHSPSRAVEDQGSRTGRSNGSRGSTIIDCFEPIGYILLQKLGRNYRCHTEQAVTA